MNTFLSILIARGHTESYLLVFLLSFLFVFIATTYLILFKLFPKKKHDLMGKCLLLFIWGWCVWVPCRQSHRSTGMLFPFLKHIFIMLTFFPLSYQKVKFQGWRNKTSTCNPEYHVATLLTQSLWMHWTVTFLQVWLFSAPTHAHIFLKELQGLWRPGRLES